MPERDELDRLIDSELARYAEPRVGLEQRVMARISLDAERLPRCRRLLLMMAAPVAVSLLIFTYFMQRTPAPRHEQIVLAPPAASTAHVENKSAGRNLSPNSVSRVHERSQKQLPRDRGLLIANERPKLETFPALQPPSASERAVMRFAAEASAAEREALATPNQELTEPIRITALHIPPLPSPGEDTN